MLFRTLASLGPLLLIWLLLLPAEAASQPRGAVDEERTVEVNRPHGSTPSTPREASRGKQVADASIRIKSARARVTGSTRSPRLRQLLPEDVKFLYVQRHIEGKNADPRSRKVDVYYYDYLKNDAYRVVVDLNTNTVQETHVTRGFRHAPFFTRAEINAGLQLMIDDPVLGPKFLEIYQNLTGQPLANVSQLNAEGGIFFPDSAAHTPLGDITADCALDRCIQFFININDEKYIDVSQMVVNLSKGKVLRVGEGVTGHNH
jgi:hypothetical protein